MFQRSLAYILCIESLILTLYRLKRRLLYLKIQFVPRCKHFLTR